MKRISEGDVAPNFDAVDQAGAPVSLAALRGRWVVLFFYPKDNTPACTAQSCAFRDAYAEFTDAGVAVVGISSDSAASHRGFADRFRLPFPLVTDEGGRLRRLFGVPRTLWVLPGRVTYVIDPEGVVRLVFNSQLRVAAHVAEALEVVRGAARGQGQAGMLGRTHA